MGGEKTLYSGMQQVVLGSSPRWRGKDRFLATQSLVLRITPAWAGKSCPALNGRRSARDHPRVGGEKGKTTSDTAGTRGSPPRGRGKGAQAPKMVLTQRITPAWAGKSRTSTGSCHFWEDHPRMGGEKPVAMHSLTTKAGSPPRGRGKGWPPPPLGLSPRITPAWAGKRSTGPPLTQTTVDHPRVGGEKRRAKLCP